MSLFIGVVGSPVPEEEYPEPQHNALEEGYLALGCASGTVHDSAWMDSSMGTDYGHGSRFEHEEASFLTKVKAKE